MATIFSHRPFGVAARGVGVAGVYAALLIGSCADSADPAASESTATPPAPAVTAPASEAGSPFAALYEGVYRTSEELVTAFAHDFLGAEDAVVEGSGDGAVNTWRITSARLDLEVTTEGFGVFEAERRGVVEEVGPVWGITHVADLKADDAWYLTAAVPSIGGIWTAQLGFPPPQGDALVKLASGDWEVAASTQEGEITLDLPAKPVAPVRVFIFHYERTDVTGVHGVILDPIDLIEE